MWTGLLGPLEREMRESLVKPLWAGACFHTLHPVGQRLESGGPHVSISILSLAPSPTISLSLLIFFFPVSGSLSAALCASLFLSLFHSVFLFLIRQSLCFCVSPSLPPHE